MEGNKKDIYVEALHEIFNNCCKTVFGRINVEDLHYLFTDLQLGEELSSAVAIKLSQLQSKEVTFEQFYEAFLGALQDLELNGTRESNLVSGNHIYSNLEENSAKSLIREKLTNLVQQKIGTSDMRDNKEVSAESFEEGLVKQILLDFGLGRNGYLSRGDLLTLCAYLEINDVTMENLSLIFPTLSSSSISSISLGEFSQALFSEEGLLHGQVSSLLVFDKKSEKSGLNWLTSGRSRLKSSLGNGAYTDFFAFLDFSNEGIIDVKKLCNFWEEIGINDGKEILSMKFRDIGTRKILVSELLVAFDHELQNMEESSAFSQAVILTLRYQLSNFRTKYDQVLQERNKVQLELSELTRRLDRLLMEAEERYDDLEKNKQTEILTLQNTIQSLQKKIQPVEPDLLPQQNSLEHAEQQQENERLKARLGKVENDLRSAESEMREMTVRCGDLQSERDTLMRRVNDLLATQQQVSELTTNRDETMKKYEELTKELKTVQEKNKHLKDESDELMQRINDLLKIQNKQSKTSAAAAMSHQPLQLMLQQEQLLPQQGSLLLDTDRDVYERQVLALRKSMLRELEDIQRAFRLEMSRMEGRHLEEVEVLHRKRRTEQEVTDSLTARAQHQTLNPSSRLESSTPSKSNPAENITDTNEIVNSSRRDRSIKQYTREELNVELDALRERLNAEHTVEHTVQTERFTKQYTREELNIELDALRERLKAEHRIELEEIKRSHAHQTDQLISERLEAERKLTRDHLEILHNAEDDAEMLRRKIVRLQSDIDHERELNRELLDPRSIHTKTRSENAQVANHAHRESSYKDTVQMLEKQLQTALQQLHQATTTLARTVEEKDALMVKLETSVDRIYYQSMVTRLAELEALNRRLQDLLQARALESRRVLENTQIVYRGRAESSEQRCDQLELLVSSLKFVVDEQVQQIKHQNDQLMKNDVLIKDLYKENSSLVETLQFAEKQRVASNEKIFQLSEKCEALSKVIKDSAAIVAL